MNQVQIHPDIYGQCSLKRCLIRCHSSLSVSELARTRGRRFTRSCPNEAEALVIAEMSKRRIKKCFNLNLILEIAIRSLVASLIGLSIYCLTPNFNIAPRGLILLCLKLFRSRWRTATALGPKSWPRRLHILKGAGAPSEIETIDIGEKVYLAGNSSGIEPSSWDSLRRTKVFLKAPITTPQGGGYKSLNVTVRKTLGLYANVRPCVSYHPFVKTKHPNMDVVIVRENEEDLYAGIEHRQTAQVVQCLKLISRPGSEKIVRYAFEYARRNNRKKVTCFTKDNIMKLTDGLFHKVFDEIATQYPDIENEHWIVDIGAAKLADTPEAFDVLVMPNLYGDVLSDVAAQIAGSVGLAGFGEHWRARLDV